MRTCGDFGGPGPGRAGRTDVHMQFSPPLTYHLRNISRDDSSSSATWNGSELAAGVCGPAGNPPRSRTNEHHGRIRRAGSGLLLRAAIEGSTSPPRGRQLGQCKQAHDVQDEEEVHISSLEVLYKES